MKGVSPPAEGRRRDPAAIGDLLGSVFSSRVQGTMLDLDFLKTLWDGAAPVEIVHRAVPVRVEKRVLTIVTADPATRAEAHRRRAEIARRLVSAAGFPKARLRVRVELGSPALQDVPARRGRGI